MADIAASDNQTNLDLAAPPSSLSVSVFDVPLLRATAANLAGMGAPVYGAAAAAVLQIVPWPRAPGAWRPLCEGSGVGGGGVAGVFLSSRRGDVMYSENVALKRRYVIGWHGDPAAAAAAGDAGAGGDSRSVLTHEANYHADGGQIIAAQPGAPAAFVLLLAPPGDDVKPSSFRAFLVDGSDGITGVHINAGTWHQPAFALDGTAILDNRQGAVHACAAVSFVSEFGGYLRVPLDRSALCEPPPPPPLPPRAPRLARMTLHVRGSNVRAALEFYVAAFGLREPRVAPDGTYGELDAGAVALAFCAAPADVEAGAAEAGARRGDLAACVVGLEVADVDAAYARAVAAGAVPVAPPAARKPWGGRACRVRDPEGCVVELCAE